MYTIAKHTVVCIVEVCSAHSMHNVLRQWMQRSSEGICRGHMQSTENSTVIALSDLFCSWFKRDYELRLNCTSL